MVQERGHGRINRWTTWATGIDESIGLPYATRLTVIRRDMADLTGQPVSNEITIVGTSPACQRPTFPATPGNIGGSRISSTGPATPSGTKTTSRTYIGNGPRAMATFPAT